MNRNNNGRGKKRDRSGWAGYYANKKQSKNDRHDQLDSSSAVAINAGPQPTLAKKRRQLADNKWEAKSKESDADRVYDDILEHHIRQRDEKLAGSANKNDSSLSNRNPPKLVVNTMLMNSRKAFWKRKLSSLSTKDFDAIWKEARNRFMKTVHHHKPSADEEDSGTNNRPNSNDDKERSGATKPIPRKDSGTNNRPNSNDDKERSGVRKDIDRTSAAEPIPRKDSGTNNRTKSNNDKERSGARKDIDRTSEAKSISRKPVGRKHLREFVVGQTCPATVVAVKPFGVFLDIGCYSDALCHIRNISDHYIQLPELEKMFKKGDQIAKVRIIDVDYKRGKISVRVQTERGIKSEREPMQVERKKSIDESKTVANTGSSSRSGSVANDAKLSSNIDKTNRLHTRPVERDPKPTNRPPKDVIDLCDSSDSEMEEEMNERKDTNGNAKHTGDNKGDDKVVVETTQQSDSPSKTIPGGESNPHPLTHDDAGSDGTPGSGTKKPSKNRWANLFLGPDFRADIVFALDPIDNIF